MLDVVIAPGVLTILLFGTFFIAVFSGLPLAFALGGVSVIFGVLFWGSSSIYMFSVNLFGLMQNFVLASIPMFIFMGTVMQHTGIGQNMYELVYRTLGQIKGGLGIGTVFICTVFAAMSGASGPATVTMGLIALPSMLRRKYSNEIALGSIAAGGALGILIPPSIPMILYAAMTGTSVGRMFLGGVVPGILLGILFSGYIAIRCAIKPEMGPSIQEATTSEGAAESSVAQREPASMAATLGFPVLLIIAVLGSMYAGITTPTEAAALGALGAMLIALFTKQLSFKKMRLAGFESLKLTTMIMWIALGGVWFSSVNQAIGGPSVVASLLLGEAANPWLVLIFMQLIFVVLGFFMDSTGIIFLTMPIFFPIATQLGFDPVWYGVLFIINMEIGYLTPPFGVNLFYLKALRPDTAMVEIYKSVLPFIGVQLFVLVLCMLFPEIVTFLPDLLMG